MYSIGEFSKLCMVTTKTLRHYDAEGLLKPAHTSAETGYRYYEAFQFRDMLLIQRLKEYGFRLDEISQLLRCDKQYLRARIAAKYEERKAELVRQNTLLQSMQTDLDKITKGMDIMTEIAKDIKVVETKPMAILSVRDTIAIADFDQLFGRAYALAASESLQPAGPPLAIYHSEDFDPSSTDVEVGFPVNTGTGKTRELAGGTCVMGVHLGAYARLNETYTALAKWIDENGYKIAAPPYEKYLNSPGEVSDEQLVTEVYFPVSK